MRTYGSYSLAESPVYDERTGKLYFVDILTHKLLIKEEESIRELLFDDFVTSVHLTDDEKKLLVTTRDSIFIVNQENEDKDKIISLSLPPEMRFNDGTVAPDGALYMGTMRIDPPRSNEGKLYRIDSSSYSVVAEGFGIPNGMVFLDERHFVHVDSSLDIVRLYEADGDKVAEIRNYRFCEGECPDGLALDEDGILHIALWNKGEIALLDASSFEEKGRIPGFKTSVSSIAISDDGRAFVTSGEDSNGRGILYE